MSRKVWLLLGVVAALALAACEQTPPGHTKQIVNGERVGGPQQGSTDR